MPSSRGCDLCGLASGGARPAGAQKASVRARPSSSRPRPCHARATTGASRGQRPAPRAGNDRRPEPAPRGLLEVLLIHKADFELFDQQKLKHDGLVAAEPSRAEPGSSGA